MRQQSAVIFDVDGPLLHLKPPEEDAFFAPFDKLFGITDLSRDWDTYKVRNDRDIVTEILKTHLGQSFSEAHYDDYVQAYDEELRAGFASGTLEVTIVDKAAQLVSALSAQDNVKLGIATANLHCAAEIRLRQADLWQHLHEFPGTADKGGHKYEVLARVIDQLDLPPQQVVFIGDNLNDLEAATRNGTHFIGYHWTEEKRSRLSRNGAKQVTGDHDETLKLICTMLNLTP